MPATDPPDPPPPAPRSAKPGWKTPTAWLAFLTVALGALSTSGLLVNAPLLSKIVGVAIAVLSVLNYALHRTALKRAYLSVGQSVSGVP